MAAEKLKLKIDFVELFGAKVKDEALRQAIGGAIIEKIVSRTQDGKSLTGGRFKGYSKNYINSLAFKVHGKSAGSVDLTLSGDMLSALEILDSNERGLTIGFANKLDNDKAYNHNVGDTLPKREFFGIQEQEKKAVASEFQDLVGDMNAIRESKTRDEFLDRATKTIAQLMAETADEV